MTIIFATVIALTVGLVAVSPTRADAVTNPSQSTLSNMQINILRLMNEERAAHHLAPLHMNTKLQAAAKAHDVRMAKANTLSHRLPGEADLGPRVTAAGYHWSRLAENAAWTSWLCMQGLYDLQRTMYNEVAPNDGHRRNILNPKLKDVGINVYYDDAHHKFWMTEDFGTPA